MKTMIRMKEDFKGSENGVLLREFKEDAEYRIVEEPSGEDSIVEALALVFVKEIRCAEDFDSPPMITEQPESQTEDPDGSVTFAVEVTSITPLSYQWQKDWMDIEGATESNYTIPSVQESDTAEYSCQVSNDSGSESSDLATLTVNDPPEVTTGPKETTAETPKETSVDGPTETPADGPKETLVDGPTGATTDGPGETTGEPLNTSPTPPPVAQPPENVKDGIILSGDGDPYANPGTARTQLRAKGLDATHVVVKVEGGYGIGLKPKEDK